MQLLQIIQQLIVMYIFCTLLLAVVYQGISGMFSKRGELERTATVAKFATVQTEGEREVTRDIEYYNLDVIISVGYPASQAFIPNVTYVKALIEGFDNWIIKFVNIFLQK